MSSTNHTTHYELSQYVSSDKPTYLGDYNGDMLKIDTGINAAKTAADTAQTDATAAGTAATNAQTTANTAVTNAATAQTAANTANTNIGTLANLNTSAKTNLVAAINEVDSDISTEATRLTNMFKFNHKQSFTTPNDKQNCNYLDGSVTVEANDDYSIFKIYGDYRVNVTTSSDAIIFVKFNTDLRPTTDYALNPIGFVYNENSNIQSIAAGKVYTNGVLEIYFYSSSARGVNPFIYISDTLHFMSEN